MVLFIQMQLCTTTLRDWLVKRNNDISRFGKYAAKEHSLFRSRSSQNLESHTVVTVIGLLVLFVSRQ